MRFLIVDANYPGFLESVYQQRPGLPEARYDEQLAAIRAGLFGEAHFQAAALHALGHEADVIVANAKWAQRAWAIEHGLGHLVAPQWKLRLRRGVVPWVSRKLPATSWEIVVSQVKAHRPDVVYVGILDTMPTSVVARIRTLTRLIVAQVATTIPPGHYKDYDLVLSSIPSIVDHFRAMNIDAEWVPLAFEPSIVNQIPTTDRDIPVSFVGSFSAAHPDRAAIIEAVANIAPLQTWTADPSFLSPGSPINPTIRGIAFGRDMYGVLARSHMTVNTHGTIAGPDANNLRLYEATGMGALLVTEERRNLSQLFAVGREVVVYESPTDAAEVVSYYLDHPAEAARIAAAGRERTHRDHTWAHRMARTLALVNDRL